MIQEEPDINKLVMEVNKFYTFYIKGWNEPLHGIVVAFGIEWVLIKRIISDFLFDGYTLVRRKYVKKVIRNEDVIFKEKVLASKGYMNMIDIPDFSLDDSNTPLILLNTLGKTLMFSPQDESLCYIGRLYRVSKCMIYFNAMDARGNWENRPYKCLLNKIRTIDYDNDYIESLLLYNINR